MSATQWWQLDSKEEQKTLREWHNMLRKNEPREDQIDVDVGKGCGPIDTHFVHLVGIPCRE